MSSVKTVSSLSCKACAEAAPNSVIAEKGIAGWRLTSQGLQAATIGSHAAKGYRSAPPESLLDSADGSLFAPTALSWP